MNRNTNRARRGLRATAAGWLAGGVLAMACATSALGATAPVCNMNANETGATAVLVGVSSCAAIVGQSGRPMTDITSTGAATAFQDGIGVDWRTSRPNVDVDYVIVRGQVGQPCAYLYGNGRTGGDNLRASLPATSATLTRFCSDAMFPKPPPVTTATTGCTGDAAPLQAAVTGNPTFRTAIGVGTTPNSDPTTPGQAQMAICAESMVECDNQCYRPANYPANTQQPQCVADAVTGALPLSCRPCETAVNRAPMRGRNYCWELSHQANETTQTFVPVRVTQPGEVSWQTYEGSTCYLFTTRYFGQEYSYYSPRGCGTK